MGRRIVIADGLRHHFGDDFAPERAAWEAQGLDLSLAGCTTEAELVEAGTDAEILVYLGLYTPFTASVLAQLPACRLVTRYGIGMDSVDLDAATAQGIVVANAAEYCVPEVADHATALILAAARHVVRLDRFVRGGNWQGAVQQTGRVRRLQTRTVGLVGFGRIARQVARNLRPMVGTILAADPFVAPETAAAEGVTLVPLDELLVRADVVSVHTPLLPATRGLVGAGQLARMKPTATLVNTSRGPVVDQAALVDALQAGRIAGAALDVFDSEPLAADSPLRAMENVILTPHFAAYSEDALADLRASVIETVLAVAQDRWPRYVMNPQVEPKRPLRREGDGG